MGGTYLEENLLILGSGGYGKMVAEAAEAMGKWELIDCLDDEPEDRFILENSTDFANRYRYAFPAVEENKLRLVLMKALKKAGYLVPVIIHPSAVVSHSAHIDPGSAVLAGAVVSAGAEVGACCVVGIGALIEYDAFLEKGVQLCAGAIVKENTNVPEATVIKSGKLYAR